MIFDFAKQSPYGTDLRCGSHGVRADIGLNLRKAFDQVRTAESNDCCLFRISANDFLKQAPADALQAEVARLATFHNDLFGRTVDHVCREHDPVRACCGIKNLRGYRARKAAIEMENVRVRTTRSYFSFDLTSVPFF